MKKLFIAVPLLVGAAGAVAIAGTSQYAGSHTKTEYHQLLAVLNEQSPLVFMNQAYTEGLTASKAITRVMSSQKANAEILFSLHHDIKHATLRMADDGLAVGTVSIDTTLQDLPSATGQWTSLFTDSTSFILKTDFNVNGEVRYHLDLSDIEFSEEGKQQSWSAILEDMVKIDSTTIDDPDGGTLLINDIELSLGTVMEGMVEILMADVSDQM